MELETLSPDEEIEWMIRNYPILFENRVQALLHLFFTIGNGYDWVDGELVHDHHDEDRPKQTLQDRYHYIDDPEVLESMREHFEEQQAKDNAISEKAAELTHLWGPPRGGEKQWPRCDSKYAQICNIPADVKPEWQGAAWEFLCHYWSELEKKDIHADYDLQFTRAFINDIKEHKNGRVSNS